MRSRSVWSNSAVSILGLGLGLAAGAAAGLLAAPMRGVEMRRSLRTRADDALDRGRRLVEEGRDAFRTRLVASDLPPATPLSATMGEIAQMHSGNDFNSLEARS
jgi:hypothetical protein